MKLKRLIYVHSAISKQGWGIIASSYIKWGIISVAKIAKRRSDHDFTNNIICVPTLVRSSISFVNSANVQE